ncbi:bifunctional nuclease family protein [Gordonia sp. TBRC 11910]|uniref:Bifunctional nuclease family protein n=1 Tax=Gordonia asplenii TaxID=2725283 RepID=A0A848KPZ9_9ACTN|nr:bifunctional nuclease family protein [Gordonia asplenii]NMO00312.1 bifunctional nuclease family protein [Gordonia asplenii]
MGEMKVVGIRVEPPQSQPVLLLRETDGERYLAIWIGQSEAASIALRQKGIEPPRPLTHDLIVNLVKAFGRRLVRVRIVDMQEGTFYAEMVFDDDLSVSARPSDAIAVALRVGVPILADEDVLVEAGLIIPDEDTDADEETAAAADDGELSEDEVERFKEFLDSVSPDDFKAGE